MRRAFTILIGILLGICKPLPGGAASDVGDGEQFAIDVCAECHAIEAGAYFSPDASAPPFQKIADTPGMNAQALFVWFHTPHPSMPNFILSEEQQQKIIAYILSLKSE
jgi:mono/diheme cytochrome c family protein